MGSTQNYRGRSAHGPRITLAAIVTIFAAVVYSRESGFAAYAALFAIPYIAFGLAPRS